MTTHPTPADLLVRHAPTPPEDDLSPLLDRVRERRAPSYPPRRTAVRVVVAASVVAGVVLAALLIPSGLRSPSSTASAIDQLALAAATAEEEQIPAGSFLHLVQVENPGPASEYDSAYLHPGWYPRTVESWSSQDGQVWRQDTTADGTRERFLLPAFTGRNGVPGTSPQDLAALPVDPQQLLDYLRPKVQGSLSNDEAVFAWLQEALRTGGGPPENRRAMISALALLPHIDTERRLTYDGAPCLEVRYAEPLRAGTVQGMCFDEETAAVLEERLLEDGRLAFRTLLVQRDVVPEVPAQVLDEAEATPVEN